MQDKTVKKIGQYRVSDQLLGQGSFSSVYLAWDSSHNPVAAKVIALSPLQPQQLLDIQREISILRRCRHENVVGMLEAKKTHRNLYIFMEYCSGGSLEQLLREKGRLGEQDAMRKFGQIVRGMQVLAACSVVHRDLKPANILLSGEVVRIADFGLARKCREGELLQSYKGSPLNMAPQILRGHSYSEKVDVYSAGTVLYEMLFGVSPHEASTFAQLLAAIDKGVQDFHSVKLSKEIRVLLRGMLQSDPAERLTINGVVELLTAYEEMQREKRLDNYRQLSLSGLVNYGAMGAMLAALGLASSPPRVPSPPSSMDLRLYGRLCSRLAVRS